VSAPELGFPEPGTVPLSPAPFAPVVELLRAVLARTGEIVVQSMPESHTGRYLGLTHFPSNLMYINDDQDDAEWLETLVHELHHMLDGPVHRKLKGAAELKVRAATADTLAAMGVTR
jgi:hypothetical protein